jgi:hypothetical protein
MYLKSKPFRHFSQASRNMACPPWEIDSRSNGDAR